MADRAPLVLNGNKTEEFKSSSDDLLVSVGDLSDVDLTGQQDGDFLRREAGIWTPWRPFDVSFSYTQGLINQTQTLEPFFDQVVNIPEDGNYFAIVQFFWSFNDGGNDFISQFVVDGTEYGFQRQEPKDAGGGGISLPTTSGGTANSGTDQRHPATHMFAGALTAGNKNFTLNFSSNQDFDEAAIYSAIMNVRRTD